MKNLMQSVKENLSFVAVCLLIFAALVLVAWLFERFVIKERRKLGGARYVATMGMCAALGAVLMVLEIPVFLSWISARSRCCSAASISARSRGCWRSF